MTDQSFILTPTTGFKLMEHIEIHHEREVGGRCNARELKALHDKMHLLNPEQDHTHRKQRRAI